MLLDFLMNIHFVLTPFLSGIAIDGKTVLKNIHYKNEDFLNLSLNQLLSLEENISFDKQVVMCIDQDGIYRKSSCRPTIDPLIIKGMVIFGRNIDNGQIYRLKRLQASLHFSKSLKVALEIETRIRFLSGDDHGHIRKTQILPNDANFTIEECGIFLHNVDGECTDSNTDEIHGECTMSDKDRLHCSKTSDHNHDNDLSSVDSDDPDLFPSSPTPPITYLRIPRKTNHPFTPSMSKSPVSCPLKDTRKYIQNAIDFGLLKYFSFSEKKRGKGKSSPVMSFGYTQTNCKQYSHNRKTDSGATGPGLTNITTDLPENIRDEIIKAMNAAIKCTPRQDKEYDLGDGSSERENFRKNLNIELGVKYNKKGEPISLEVKCEAFTIIIPLVLSSHRDVMNDALKTMDSVIQINHTFKMSDNEDKIPALMRKWMNENGVVDLFPISIIMYSRQVVATIISKIDKTRLLATQPKLPNIFVNKAAVVDKFCKAHGMTRNDLHQQLANGYRVMMKCLTSAFFDMESSRSIVNTNERDGIINHLSLKQVIKRFELEQTYSYELIRNNRYEELVWKRIVPPHAKTKMNSIIDTFVTKHYESPVVTELTNKSGTDLAIFLNYGSSAKDLRKRLGRERYTFKEIPRRRSKRDGTSNKNRFKVMDLCLDFVDHMSPLKYLHLDSKSKEGLDHYLDFKPGKTFMFDRLTLSKHYVEKCHEVESDDEHDDFPILKHGKTYFSWRDTMNRSDQEQELLRIVPSCTKIFNGPSFDLPCGWNKMVRGCISLL